MIFPLELDIIAIERGTSISITGTPVVDMVPSAVNVRVETRAETGGTVLFARNAASCVESACCLCTPVAVPSSSTPRNRLPPSVLLSATTVSMISLSESFFRSLLNSTERVSCSGIARALFPSAPDRLMRTIIGQNQDMSQ